VHEDDCWIIEIRQVDVADLLKEVQTSILSLVVGYSDSVLS